jgi:hypothetical protein
MRRRKNRAHRYTWIVPLISLACVAICGKVALDATVTAHLYRRLEANERAALEGFLRTATGRIDSAYVCKEKP